MVTSELQAIEKFLKKYVCNRASERALVKNEIASALNRNPLYGCNILHIIAIIKSIINAKSSLSDKPLSNDDDVAEVKDHMAVG